MPANNGICQVCRTRNISLPYCCTSIGKKIEYAGSRRLSDSCNPQLNKDSRQQSSWAAMENGIIEDNFLPRTADHCTPIGDCQHEWAAIQARMRKRMPLLLNGCQGCACILGWDCTIIPEYESIIREDVTDFGSLLVYNGKRKERK